MKSKKSVSYWKKCLSYIKDVYLESRTSDINDHIQLYLVNNRFQLCTEDAIYSFDEKYDNFYQAFKKVNWTHNKCKKTLILGLGMGSIPYMLEYFFDVVCNYHAVEIDEEIVDLAQKYSLSRIKSPLEIFITDAARFVEVTTEKYDLICMDVFVNDTIPTHLMTHDFLQVLKTRINHRGRILFNMLSASESDRLNCDTYYKNVFQNTFNTATYISVKGNRVLSNLPFP